MIIFGLIAGCTMNHGNPSLKSQMPKSISLQIICDGEGVRTDAEIRLSVRKIKAMAEDFNVNACAVSVDGKEVASQHIDFDNDGNIDHILCIADLDEGKQISITIHYATSGSIQRDYPKRTQAVLSHKVGGKFVPRGTHYVYEGGQWQDTKYLRVPDEHNYLSNFMRFEGPGWESDKVGYRFYLDSRNAVDIFGKYISDMVLQNVGLEGDSYHEPADWGLDIFKVGNSLGIGSIGMWYDGKANRVAETDSILCVMKDNGPVYSRICTKYYGWQTGPTKTTLQSCVSIAAGSRLTHVKLNVDKPVPNLCTGLSKHENTEFWISPEKSKCEWNYIAQWGRQSLFDKNDELGIAVFYPKSRLEKLTEDDLNQVVILNPVNNQVEYYFLAAWCQEPGGIQTMDAFKSYLHEVQEILNHPVEVIYP